MVALALALATLAGAAPLRAQPAASAERVEAPVATLGLPLYPTSGLEVRWRLLRAAPAGSDEEQRALEAVLAARAELGIPELPEHASVLVQEARAAWRAGAYPRAESLLGWALVLAPSSAEPAFARAALTWQTTPWAVGELVEASSHAYERAWSSPLDGPMTRLHWGLLALWIVLAVTLTFVLVQLARYARLAAYDLASLVGHAVSRNGTGLVLIAFLALPAVILQSPILLLLLALALPFLYQNRSEWVATMLLLAVLAALPFWMGRLGELVALGSSAIANVFVAERGPCGPECVSRLEGLAQGDGEASCYAAVAAGSVRLRSGQPEDRVAAAVLLAAQLEHPVLGALAWLHLGRAHYAAGDLEGAGRAWDEAARAANGAATVEAAARFNQYRVAQARGADGDTALEQARALAPDAVAAALLQAEPRVNRWLMATTTPPERVLELAGADAQARTLEAADELWAPIGGRLDRHAAVGVALGALVLVALGGLLRRRTLVAAACPTCGAIMSPRDAPDAAVAGYCPDCYALFMAGAGLGVNERHQLERRVDLHRKRSRRWWLVGNVAGAGLGFLGRGTAWLGLPLVAVAVAGAVLWFVAAPAVPRALAFTPGAFDGRAALAILCWVVAYAAAWIWTWARRGRRAR